MPFVFIKPDSNVIKEVARRKLRYAVKKGLIVKASRCEDCGLKFNKDMIRPHAHHSDYSKPLDVNWLCPSCHLFRHRNDRAYKRYCEENSIVYETIA